MWYEEKQVDTRCNCNALGVEYYVILNEGCYWIPICFILSTAISFSDSAIGRNLPSNKITLPAAPLSKRVEINFRRDVSVKNIGVGFVPNCIEKQKIKSLCCGWNVATRVVLVYWRRYRNDCISNVLWMSRSFIGTVLTSYCRTLKHSLLLSHKAKQYSALGGRFLIEWLLLGSSWFHNLYGNLRSTYLCPRSVVGDPILFLIME